MTIVADTFVDIDTSRGPMRVHLFIPQGMERHPGVIFYSEIFQVTGPIRRMASALSGHGYLVAVPEVYHEFEPPGTVLAYDQAGSDRGNELKYTKELASYDEDTDTVVKFLRGNERCTGRVGSYGVCLGGHLAVRLLFTPRIFIRARLARARTTTHCRDSEDRGRQFFSFGAGRTPTFPSRGGKRSQSGSM